jgi:hypothetical protein
MISGKKRGKITYHYFKNRDFQKKLEVKSDYFISFCIYIFFFKIFFQIFFYLFFSPKSSSTVIKLVSYFNKYIFIAYMWKSSKSLLGMTDLILREACNGEPWFWFGVPENITKFCVFWNIDNMKLQPELTRSNLGLTWLKTQGIRHLLKR